MILSWESFNPALNCDHLGTKNSSTGKAVARHPASTWNLRCHACKTLESCPTLGLLLASKLGGLHMCGCTRKVSVHRCMFGSPHLYGYFESTGQSSSGLMKEWSPQRSHIICVKIQWGGEGGRSKLLTSEEASNAYSCSNRHQGIPQREVHCVSNQSLSTVRLRKRNLASLLLELLEHLACFKMKAEGKYLFNLFWPIGLGISVLFSH